MCKILDFLVHVWITFSSYFSGASSKPTVLPLSTASSTIYAARSRTYASSGTKVNSEPETWKTQKEQFLRHPSLRRSSSRRSNRTADGSQRSDVAPGNSANHWDHYVGQEKHAAECPDSLVPQTISPHLPAVIVTPCTPSVDSTKPSEENLQFASPAGSPLDMTIASYKAIIPAPTILKPNRTPSRRQRDKEKSMAKRIRFETTETNNILKDLENPFVFSEENSESPPFSSPEGDHLSCFPDSDLLPPESPSPPAAESTIRNLDQRDDNKPDTLAYPWDFSSWTNRANISDTAGPDQPSYITSTPPRKHRGDVYETRPLKIVGKDLSEAVLELLPYPDVFDLDMYFCEITLRRSLPPPPGLGNTESPSTASVPPSQDASGKQQRENELDTGTTPLGPAFDLTPTKKDKSPTTTSPQTPLSERRNRLWTMNNNKLLMPSEPAETDVVNFKDVYRHTAYSKPSVIYSTKLPSPPPTKYVSPTADSRTSPIVNKVTPVTRPLLTSKPGISNHGPKPSNEINRPQRQRLSPIVLPPPPIVIVSQYPFDLMRPRRNRNRSRSPSLNEKNSTSLTSTSGPKPEDLIGDSDSARSMESLKARLKEAYDNFSKPTWIDESESWERVPLT